MHSIPYPHYVFCGILAKWLSYIKEIRILVVSSAANLFIRGRVKYKEIESGSFVAWPAMVFLVEKNSPAQYAGN